MDLEEYALAGMGAGAVAGTVKGAYLTAAFLLFRERIVAETRAAIEAGVDTAGMDATTVYWVGLITTAPSVVLLTAMMGTVVALALGWRGGRSTPVVVAVSVLVGVGDGFTTHLPGISRPAMVAPTPVVWLLFAGVFLRVTRSERGVGAMLPDVSVDRRLVATLLGAGGVGVLALAPTLAAADLSPSAVVGNVVVVGGLVGAAVLAGTTMGPQVGLGAPAVAAWLDGDPPDARPLAVAAGAGAGAGTLILCLDVLVFGPLVEGAVRESAAGSIEAAPGWARLLAGSSTAASSRNCWSASG